jgi:hypothetical protein
MMSQLLLEIWYKEMIKMTIHVSLKSNKSILSLHLRLQKKFYNVLLLMIKLNNF